MSEQLQEIRERLLIITQELSKIHALISYLETSVDVHEQALNKQL